MEWPSPAVHRPISLALWVRITPAVIRVTISCSMRGNGAPVDARLPRMDWNGCLQEGRQGQNRLVYMLQAVLPESFVLGPIMAIFNISARLFQQLYR